MLSNFIIDSKKEMELKAKALANGEVDRNDDSRIAQEEMVAGSLEGIEVEKVWY